MISFSASMFFALFLESLMYGTALAMGCATVLVLSRLNAEGRVPRRQLIVVLCVMLMVATPHIVISFIRAFRAFVLSPEHGSHDPIENIFVADAFDDLLNAKNTLLLIQTILGDAVNIWRCYVIYNRKSKYIVIPSIIELVGFVCGCLMIKAYSDSASANAIYDSISLWAETYESIMIVTNIYCTVAVSWKIYKTTQVRARGSHARCSLVVIAETGLLYTSSLALCLGLWVTQSNLLFIAIDLVVPLVPCIFCFMILQAQLNRSSARHGAAHTSPSQEVKSSACVRMRRMLGHNRAISISTVQPVQIQVLREEGEYYPDHDVILVQKGGPNDDGSFGNIDEA